MRVLVLGGTGFLGRHVAAALAARGHAVAIGSRRARPADAPARLRVRFQALTTPERWEAVLARFDAVVNCVGVLRECFAATYERVHHAAPSALAAACARAGVRLVHVSALGLHADARSGFIRSKLAGEAAIRASGADYTIARPSLLDGDGGFGARWLRRIARWPVHVVPADATGRIAMLAVADAGAAIARLVELRGSEWREAELGGLDCRTFGAHLAALRAVHRRARARLVRLPAPLARIASHACDFLHVTPYSFGHLELLRRDNVPRFNALPGLLGRAPLRVGAATVTEGRGTASARDRASRPRTAIRGGGSTPSARAP